MYQQAVCNKVAKIMKAMSWLTIIPGTICLLSALVPSLPEDKNQNETLILGLVAGAALIGLGILARLIATATLQQKPWGIAAAKIYGALNLFLFPVGTFVGYAILSMLLKKSQSTVPVDASQTSEGEPLRPA